jgi:hypothetical protein
MFPESPHALARNSDRVITDRTIRRESRAGFFDGERLPALRTFELDIYVFSSHLVPTHPVLLAKVTVDVKKNYAG